MAITNSDADGILSALIPRWVHSNYLSLFAHHNPVWMKFLLNGAIQTGGFGRYLREAFRFPTTTGPQMERVSDSLTEVETQFMTGYTACDFTPAKFRMDWALDRFEMSQFGSETEMCNWAEDHGKNAVDRFVTGLEQDLWAAEETSGSGGSSSTRLGSLRTYINGAGTTATDGGAKPAALAEQSVAGFVGATGTSAVTVIGNVERAAAGAAYLVPPIMNPASADAFTILILSKVYSLAVVNGKEPGLIVVTRAIFDALQNLASLGGSNGGQLQNSSRLADIGFDAIKFRNADVVYDDLAPTAGFQSGTATAKVHNILCINPEYIGLRVREKKPDFRKVDDARPIIRYVAEMMLQLVMRGQGRFHSRHINVTGP